MISRVLKMLSVALVATVLLVSCTVGSPPRWRYDKQGQPQEYKRYARNLAVNYFSRFRRLAYRKVEKPLEHFLSEQQRQWVSEQGQPDYARRPFRSRLNENVEEWVYLKQNRLVQFVQGQIVYQGPVTDLEKTMIQYGYPQGCIIGQSEPGVELFTFTYRRPFDLENEVFSFENGNLIYSQTQR